MKHNSFYVWLMIAALALFAAVSLGGCGGSSNVAVEGGGAVALQKHKNKRHKKKSTCP